MLRPAHLFSFAEISQETNCRIPSCGSIPISVLYIWRSVEKCEYVSRLAASEEKYADATTDLSSTSIPALAHACLTMACVFWRGALMEVWNRNLSRLPSLARMPSAPRFHPAASSTALALSTLNSHFVLVDRKRDGALR